MSQDPLHTLSTQNGLDDSSLLRTLIDSLPEQVYVKDTEGRYVLNNLAHVRALGAESPEGIAGKSDFDFYPKNFAERYRADERELTRSGRALIDKEEPSVDGEGNERWHSTTKVPMRDESGKIVGLVGITRDVTERTEAEEVLRESEDRFRSLTNAAFEGIAITENGEIVEANQAFAEMYGYELSEVRGMSALEFQAPETRDEVWLKISSGFSEPYESKGLKKDGTTFDVEIRGKSAQYGGRSVRVTALRDITERKQAEEAIEQLNRQNELILNSAGEGIYGLDLQGKTTFVNPAATRLTGWDAEDLIGQHQHEVMHHTKPDGTPYPPEECPIYAALNDGVIHRVTDEVFWRKDGTSFPVEYVSTPIRERGEIVGAVVVFEDVTERKQTEEALKESEERYRAVMEQSVEAIYLHDADTKRVLESNGAFQKMMGYTEEELFDMQIYDFIAHDREDIDRNVRRSLREERRHIGERNYRRKDGSVLVVDTSATVISYGGKTALCGVARDLTERKQAEEKLKESEKRFRSLVRNATDLITVLEEDGTIRYESPTIERILGYLPEERIGEKAFDYLHPDDEGRSKATFAEALDSPGEVQPPVEFRLRHKDGSWRYMESTRTNLLNDPAVKGVVANSRDITERRRAEEALKESEERFRTAFEDSPIGVALVDLDGRRFRVNQALCEMLGYSEEELCSEKYPEHIHPGDREISSKHRRETLEKGEGSYILERRYVHADGHAVWNLTSVSLIQDSQGNPSHLVCLHQDITERKEVETKLRKSEARLAEAQRIARLGSWEWDVKTGEVSWSDETFRIYGYEPKEFVPTLDKLMELVHPDDKELVRKNIDAALYEHESYDFEHRIVRPDGEERVVHRQAEVILDEEDEPLRMIGTVLDITGRKEAEEALKESEERYRAVVELSAEAIWVFDPDTKEVLESNTSFQELLGYSAEELKEMTNYDFVTHSRENVDSAIERIVQEGRGFFGERKYRHKDGTVLDVEVSGHVIPYQGEEVVCGVARDLTERKELEEQLRHQAFHDSLTELPNRALFLDRLGHALARTRREDGPVAVLLMDLNDFKVVNDSLGHDAGNAVLVEVAKRLRRCMRPGDTAGRIFGDEFAVLLEAPSGIEEASRVAERLQKGLQAPFDVDGREVFVSLSIGIALGESPEDQPEELLRHADLAMYEAKRRGRAEYEVYKPSMDTRAVDRMDLENELRRAVEREEFEVHYQPVIELETGGVAGFEALARWRHPERGLVDAEEFIELAEVTGLIRPIGQGVLEEACRHAKEWGERYPDGTPWMSVNFSASQFSRQPDLIPKVLDEIGLDPNVLQLEITERAVMDDAEYSIGKLKKLKGQGVSFAIDDYGMGYSCLYYLKRMPVDFLKIDRSFITGLGEGDPGDEAIVSGTIGLAHALGLKVVAEGVETEEQLAKLKELGCDLAQGFHFAKPLPSDEAERLLVEGVSC